jgi:(2Fe-2S) ferredoxin
MTADKAKEVIERHLKGGNPVTEYTIGKVLS